MRRPPIAAAWECWPALPRTAAVADVTNMVDYYLLNIYMATWDWPHNNWVAARERSDRGRYRLYIWDAEGAMYTRGNRPVTQEMIQPFISSGNGELRDLEGITVFLASSASDYITGQTIYVDGGFTAK